MSFSHLRDVLAEVEPLGSAFAGAGHRLFLVGGIVRDQMLDEPLDASSDIDLTTDALPAEIKRVISPMADDVWAQGEKFGTIGMRAGGREYEITTHRAESYASDSRKPQVSFGDSIEVDLSRRDFTVNAMAIELPDGELVDPYGGVADLEARLLRTPLSADTSFGDDPLRMLRAARFATKYSLVPDPALIESATRLRERLRIVAIERIGVELCRLLNLTDATVGLEFMNETGLLSEVLGYGDPALNAQIQSRSTAAIVAAGALPPEWRQRLAGIGLATFDTTTGVQQMCRRLRLSRNDERRIVELARSACSIVETDDVDPPALRRWIVLHGRRLDGGAEQEGPADRWPAASHAAVELANIVFGPLSGADRFGAALLALSDAEDLNNISYLGGDQIMAALDVKAGPVIGRALAYLQEEYFDRGPLPSAAQAELLRLWWADQATNA